MHKWYHILVFNNKIRKLTRLRSHSPQPINSPPSTRPMFHRTTSLTTVQRCDNAASYGTRCRLVQAYCPKFLQSPVSTPFLRGRPWTFAHVFVMCPSEPFTIFFSSSARHFGFCIFWGFLGLKGSHISSEKKTNTFVNGSAGAHYTCAIFQGISLINGVDIWTFVR